MADTTYDYIIVGAGSAGCVLADRLTRDGKSSVLLLEAGSANDSMYIHMPRGFMKILYHRDFYWKFPIEKEGDREPGETFHYGKGLGGSSAVNGTWYYRGYPGDYDQWEGFGAEGWNWAAIEKAYSEMEDYREPGAHSSRGKGGPLQVTATKDNSALTRATIEAGRQMGLPVLDDINTPATESVGPTQMTVDRRGRRSAAHAAFLKNRKGRRLEIRTGALVQKVTFEGKRATGVICRIGGVEQTFAGREVILSAGVLQSPKILQLSGIGAPELLARHDIPLVHANPEVGRNLGDHMMLRMSFKLKGAHGLNREFRGWRLLKNVAQYYLRRTGLMAVNVPGVSAMLSSTGDKTWPDIQIGIAPFSRLTNRDGHEVGSPKTDLVPGISAIAFFLRTESRGTVEIRSTDAADAPVVHANWFTANADRQHYLDLFHKTREYMRQPALKDFVGEEIRPGAEIVTDEQILDTSPQLMTTGLHHTGTCRMGREGWGVVDGRLKVWGVEGLRVVDCSVMPTTISGNTNGPAMATAWRAADLILEDRAG